MTFNLNDYVVLPIIEEQLRNLPRAIAAEEDERNLTEQQFCEIIGLPIETVRSLVQEGMPKNPNGTFDINACDEWCRCTYDPPKTKEECAEEFLLDMLEDSAMSVKKIHEIGTSEAFGFSERTIERAKGKLRILSKRDGKEWLWELPTAGAQ